MKRGRRLLRRCVRRQGHRWDCVSGTTLDDAGCLGIGRCRHIGRCRYCTATKRDRNTTGVPIYEKSMSRYHPGLQRWLRRDGHHRRPESEPRSLVAHSSILLRSSTTWAYPLRRLPHLPSCSHRQFRASTTISLHARQAPSRDCGKRKTYNQERTWDNMTQEDAM